MAAMRTELTGGGVHGVDRKGVMIEIGQISEAWCGRSGRCHDDEMSRTDDHWGCSDAGVARSGDLRPSQRMGGGEASGVNRYDAVVGRTPPDTLGEILGAAVAESSGGCELLFRTFGDACIGASDIPRRQHAATTPCA